MRAILATLILVVATAVAVRADERPNEVGDAAKAAKRSVTMEELKRFYADEHGRITTDWTDTETRQQLYDAFTRAGYLQVMSEGKVVDGRLMYRKAFKLLSDAHPDAAPLKQWCNTALTQEAFEKRNKELDQQGYVLMQKHAYKDEDGLVLFCASWVQFPPRGE